MNQHYNQLGKIFLEITNPQNPAARRDIAAAKERARESGQSFKRGSLRRKMAADIAKSRRKEKPEDSDTTTYDQGQRAMAEDPKQRDPHEPPHPSRRRRKDDWTVYKRIGSILSEWESVPQTDHFSKENVAAAKKRKAATEDLAKKRKGVKHSTDKPIGSLDRSHR